jgi:hypothetical protein
MHAQLTVASDAACENVASAMTGEIQPSLLQVDQQTGRHSLTHVRQSRKRIFELSLHDTFLYDHLPKAGGSFIRGIFESPETLGKVIPTENFRLVDEASTLTADMRRETFTVGSVRNPCEYYVSNWAFFGKLDGKIEKEQVYGVSENLDTPEDQLRFKKWLNWLMPDAKPPGLLTSRVLWSYFNESVAGARRPPDRTPLEPWTEAERAIYVAAADKLEPSTVDCWIKTENVASDLRTCLALFEDQAGSKIVNWVEFDKIIEQREKQHADVKMEVWTKNSGHKKCNFYFDAADPSLKEYVYKLDYAIFNKFGYPRCCSSDEV